MLQLSEVAEEDKSECMKASVGPMQDGSEGCIQKARRPRDCADALLALPQGGLWHCPKGVQMAREAV